MWSKTTNEEKNLFEKKSLTQQEQINISWKAEAIWTLLWSIKKVDKLELPDEQVDIEELISKMPKLLTNPKDFIESAEIRTTTEILDMSDLIYRIHWATRDAYLNNKPTPANLDEGIVIERHHSINWITYYADNWDDVTTDT